MEIKKLSSKRNEDSFSIMDLKYYLRNETFEVNGVPLLVTVTA